MIENIRVFSFLNLVDTPRKRDKNLIIVSPRLASDYVNTPLYINIPSDYINTPLVLSPKETQNGYSAEK